MKWNRNIYFYISVGALFFCYIVIFHFYQMRFEIMEFIDVKTILQVTGTIFGAYFGAKTAGKFAIQSVEKQILSQKISEKEKENQKLLRCLYLYSARIHRVIYTIDNSLPAMDIPKEFDMVLNDSTSFDPIKHSIEEDYKFLSDVDISNIYTEQYFTFLMIKDDAEKLIKLFEHISFAIAARNVDLYHKYFSEIKEVLIGLKDFQEELEVARNDIYDFEL